MTRIESKTKRVKAWAVPRPAHDRAGMCHRIDSHPRRPDPFSIVASAEHRESLVKKWT